MGKLLGSIANLGSAKLPSRALGSAYPLALLVPGGYLPGADVSFL